MCTFESFIDVDTYLVFLPYFGFDVVRRVYVEIEIYFIEFDDNWVVVPFSTFILSTSSRDRCSRHIKYR